MTNKNILIVGDSFAADYADTQVIHPWYIQLAKKDNVVNLAQAGVGQYKIRQQLVKYKDPTDVCILLITSELRIHAQQNPFYVDPTHGHHNCDLIYSDIEQRLPDARAQHLVYYFKNILDPAQARYFQNLILAEQHSYLSSRNIKCIPITFFEPYNNMYDFGGELVNLSELAKKHRGQINHLTQIGHNQVFKIIIERLNIVNGSLK